MRLNADEDRYFLVYTFSVTRLGRERETGREYKYIYKYKYRIPYRALLTTGSTHTHTQLPIDTVTGRGEMIVIYFASILAKSTTLDKNRIRMCIHYIYIYCYVKYRREISWAVAKRTLFSLFLSRYPPGFPRVKSVNFLVCTANLLVSN